MRKLLGDRFTLIELMVVLAIIMLLTSILFPALKKSRDTAKAIACLGNLKQIGIAECLYASDFLGWSPPVHSLFHSSNPLPVWHQNLSNNAYLPVSKVGKPTIVVCPGNPPYVYEDLERTYAMPLTGNGQPYRLDSGYVIGADDKKSYATASEFILSVDSAYDNPSNATFHLRQYYYFTLGLAWAPTTKIGARHNGCANAVFADGHAKSVSAQGLIGLSGVMPNNIYIQK